MGQISPHRPVLGILAAISAHDDALAWSRRVATEHWGPIVLESDAFAFDFTTFYEAEMGVNLRKCFFAFEQLTPPERLAEIKRTTNGWEADYAADSPHPQDRPLNLDPGYITEAKLVLATTKDRDHRIYLQAGIYAEVTLHFFRGKWESRPWTYPDYRSAEYHEFFTRCREYLRRRYREPPAPSSGNDS